jgi:hypothetical protein
LRSTPAVRSSPAFRHRLAGAAGALLLQGGFILLLVASLPVLRPPINLARELTLILPRPTSVPTQMRTGPAILQAAPIIVTPAVRQTAEQAAPGLAPAAPAPIPGLQNFGQALNGCAPEKYASLPPDQQARCPRPSAGVAIQELPSLMGSPSHVKDEAHWREEWAREQSPALLPCGGFVNVLCLLGKIADGSLGDYGDPSLWPHYAVKQLPVEDFYKVEQAYNAWHKAHPDAPPPPSMPKGAGR